MKKGLLVVLVLAMVFTFAFADETGLVSLGTDKGVVTVGEPVTVSYSLEVQDMSDQITTIEVMGDEIADNVFVMLIKDAPNNAQYEATKAVDADAKKTTYYIKAVELVGKKGVLKASLMNWKNEVVASKEVPFEWKDDMFTDSVELVPEAEGIYTVKASIEFEDGTVMSLEDWQGYAQLVALKKYVEETIPGLRADLVWWKDTSDETVVPYGAANKISVSAGVEYMQQIGDNATKDPYFGVYGSGYQRTPSIKWSYSKNSKPEFADVELVYNAGADNVSDESDDRNYYSAYIKFKVLSEALEGDCCGTEGGDKWAMWLAMGTGEVHNFYETKTFYQTSKFHLLGGTLYETWFWDIIKGDSCKGWIKAIFYLDPTDVKIWLEAVVGTFWYENSDIMSGINEHDDTYPNGGNVPDTYVATSGTYYQNFLTSAELNVFATIEFKEAIVIKLGALNIPLVSGAIAEAMKPVYVGSIEVDLESDSGHTVSVGFAARYDSASTITQTQWAMDAYFGSFDLGFGEAGFPIEALSTAKFGVYMNGNFNDNTDTTGNTVAFNIEDFGLVACFGVDLTCCAPTFKVGVDFGKVSSDYLLQRVWASYSHAIGTYGPVNLSGEFGVFYAMNGGYVDRGSYGKKYYGSTTGENAVSALGLAYEVTGTMTW